MTKMTNKELSMGVKTAIARAVGTGKQLSLIHHIVQIRVSNAAKIDEAIAALNAAEEK